MQSAAGGCRAVIRQHSARRNRGRAVPFQIRSAGPHFSPAFYCGGGSGHVYCVALPRAPRRTVDSGRPTDRRALRHSETDSRPLIRPLPKVLTGFPPLLPVGIPPQDTLPPIQRWAPHAAVHNANELPRSWSWGSGRNLAARSCGGWRFVRCGAPAVRFPCACRNGSSLPARHSRQTLRHCLLCRG